MDDLDRIKVSLIRINFALFIFALVLTQFMPPVNGGFEASVILAFGIGYVGIRCLFHVRELLVLPIALVASHFLMLSGPQANYALGVLTMTVLFLGLAFIGLGTLAFAIRKITGYRSVENEE